MAGDGLASNTGYPHRGTVEASPKIVKVEFSPAVPLETG